MSVFLDVIDLGRVLRLGVKAKKICGRMSGPRHRYNLEALRISQLVTGDQNNFEWIDTFKASANTIVGREWIGSIDDPSDPLPKG